MRWLTAWTVIGLGLVFLPVATMANGTDDRLKRKMAEIALLNNQMAQRRTDALQVRNALVSQLESILAEVRETVHLEAVKNVVQARQHPRLWHDLKLVAEIEAYIDRYTQKAAYYKLAGDRLGYLYQQADDDLKIVNALSDMKIDALVAQADRIIERYLTDAQTIVIRPETLPIAPPETVWDSIRPHT
jgi:hypothetical protein